MCSCNQLIREQKVKASRKDFDCMASDWIRESGLYEGTATGFSFKELRLIAMAKADRWEVKKGQPYIKQILNNSGDFFVFKARPEMHDICLKHDIYPCEC